jgi:tRNA/rRNA methyltransferase
VGATARAMKNFGLSRLVLAQPRCKLDKQAYALASHASDVLDQAEIVGSVEEALRGLTWVVGTSGNARASEAVTTYAPDEGLATLPASGGGLMFGPEDFGLDNDALDRCQALIRIPTAEYASMNLAQAVNVLASRWFTLQNASDDSTGEAAPTKAAELATRDQMERMYQDLAHLFHRIGYTDEKREKATLRLYRGMLDRAQLRPREAAALRGLASQAEWALSQAERENEPPDGSR